MTTESPDSPAEGVTGSAIRGMVAELEADWHVDSIERSQHGTDLVAILDVRTPDESRTVVLKATTADLVAPEIARAEPRLLELVGQSTNIPVPTVFGSCDDHDEYPTPFYLMSFVGGENFEGESGSLSVDARKSILREAGQNLAELHELGPLPATGKVGVQDGELTVLDTEENPRYDDYRDKLLDDCEETLDSLDSGGFFPDLAEKPERFADLVPDLREFVREAIPTLPEPDEPTYCHWDYRYGNLLIDPETGETKAVLDWANLSATEPASNLANTEFYLLNPESDGPEVTDHLRTVFRTAYTEARTEWSFDEETKERMELYTLACRLGAMACLPLWHQDASPEEKDQREKEHRQFVSQYL
ncbi:phosphotransferase family protein [Haloferax sp. DFSO60]|uniref:phosphotransferase family protein n=1 Tax=Haloferax sp. DFSO60 TaxID=3388652 RepID=UPI00397DEECA